MQTYVRRLVCKYISIHLCIYRYVYMYVYIRAYVCLKETTLAFIFCNTPCGVTSGNEFYEI